MVVFFCELIRQAVQYENLRHHSSRIEIETII
jgi:hypothetical protein